MPGILRRTRAYLEFTLRPPGYFVDFLNFASDFAPDQLSDSGKLASFQNGAPNTLCFPWKFPETQSAGDPLFSFLFSGKPYTGQLLARRRGLAGHVEGETQAALHRKTHRPSLHSHVIPHWDGVEEGAGAVLARRHEADRLPPGRVLRPLPALGARLVLLATRLEA